MFIKADLYQEILKSMPVLCVDLLILYKGKCLLLLRDNEPAKGQYWFPGGRVNKGELLADACIRKAREETGLECAFEKMVSVEETIFPKSGEMITDVHTVNVCCAMEVDSIEGLNPDRLHLGFIWCDSLQIEFHAGVNHPLSLIGFTF